MTSYSQGQQQNMEIILRSIIFTKDTFKYLNKNLNFIPTPKTNKQKLYIELESFFKLVKLKAHFKDQYKEKITTEDQIFKFQSNKKWPPNKNHHTIETYIEATERELKQHGDISGNKGCNNLFKGKRIAMQELSDHTDNHHQNR